MIFFGISLDEKRFDLLLKNAKKKKFARRKSWKAREEFCDGKKQSCEKFETFETSQIGLDNFSGPPLKMLTSFLKQKSSVVFFKKVPWRIKF